MIKNILLFILLSMLTASGFTQETETLRKKGFEAKIKGDYISALDFYKKILTLSSEDYDARLAVANLYYLQKDFEQAISYYRLIYNNDKTDVEAMNGLGRCYFAKEKYDKAAFWFSEAIRYLPDYAQSYFDLAKSYMATSRLDSVIFIYQKLLDVDNTYAEAWAGIAKMYYWKNKPFEALKYYEKALNLDPGNAAYLTEKQKIVDGLKFNNSFKTSYVQENEESYTIDAAIAKYTLSKRISNKFRLSGGLLFDHSNRDFTDLPGDTIRWYDNAWLIATYLTEKSNFSINAGYSTTDNVMTSYGLNWRYTTHLGKIKLISILDAGHDYFYYWNQVSRKTVKENLHLQYEKAGIQLQYLYGVVDKNQISDYYHNLYEDDLNPHRLFALSAYYHLFKKPDIKVSLGYSFFDFDFKSPLYYTPYERKFISPSVSFFHQMDKIYLYAGFTYNLGNEVYYEEVSSGNASSPQFKKKYLEDIDGWAGSFEAGYQFNSFTLSIGASRFYNPYYQNLVAFVSLNWLL